MCLHGATDLAASLRFFELTPCAWTSECVPRHSLLNGCIHFRPARRWCSMCLHAATDMAASPRVSELTPCAWTSECVPRHPLPNCITHAACEVMARQKGHTTGSQSWVLSVLPANHCRTATTCAFGLPGDGATLALPLPLHNGVAHGFGWPGDTAACAFHVCFLGAVGFPAQTHANMMGTHADPPTQKKLICSGRAGYACIHIYVYRYLYSYQTLLRVIRAWRGSGAPARIHKGIHRSIHRSIHRNINRSWSRGVGQARLAPLNLQYIYISI